MALSEHEQHLLDEMERGFYQNEADVMSAGGRAPRKLNYRSTVLGCLVILVGIGVLVGGVAAQQIWLGLIGFVVMLGGVILALRRTERADGAAGQESEGGGSGRPSAPSSKESLSERMERRWDKRMEDGR